MRLQVTTEASGQPEQKRGFTLAEVVIALAIITMILASIIVAYTQAAYRAEWSGYSLAAESLAIKQIEQARSARWDPASGPPIIEIYSLNLLGSNLTSSSPDWIYVDEPGSSLERHERPARHELCDCETSSQRRGRPPT